jgi:transposase InsO family protein
VQVSERTTCLLIGLSRRTIQHWRRQGLRDKRKGSVRHVAHRLTSAEEDLFYRTANENRFTDRTPEEIVALLTQEGTYIASASTLYRIFRKRKALEHRTETRKARTGTKPEVIPVTAPNQVWSWDITWLKTDVAGLFYYAYSVIDLFDRSIVGWTIETTESEEHARRMFSRIIRDLGVCPRIVHADNGNPMRGVTLAVFLDSLMVVRSYSRPRCSNDNAFIESWHKTLKYTVGYPRIFTSLEHARTWYADFIEWYNSEHLHSGLGYVTPRQKRSGEAEMVYSARNETLVKAMQQNPLRWRQGIPMVYGSMSVQTVYRPQVKSA